MLWTDIILVQIEYTFVLIKSYLTFRSHETHVGWVVIDLALQSVIAHRQDARSPRWIQTWKRLVKDIARTN